MVLGKMKDVSGRSKIISIYLILFTFFISILLFSMFSLPGLVSELNSFCCLETTGFADWKFLSIYKFGLSVCLFVFLFVSNKRQNGWTDRAQIFSGTSRYPREGLWIIKISNICLHQNSIVITFLKI